MRFFWERRAEPTRPLPHQARPRLGVQVVPGRVGCELVCRGQGRWGGLRETSCRHDLRLAGWHPLWEPLR